MICSPQYDYSRVGLRTLLAAAQAVTADDTPAMNEIVRRFEPLAKRFAGGLSKKTPAIYDDLLNAGRYAVVQAVRKHDGRPGFPTFAEMHVRGAIYRVSLQMLRERGEMVSIDSAEDVASNSDDVRDLHDRMAPFGSGAVAQTIGKMDATRQKMLMMRYAFDVEMKDIARALGVSAPAVSQRFATMHRMLRAAHEAQS
jgi:RNA polymerase sigma factor (sigma-70 family)